MCTAETVIILEEAFGRVTAAVTLCLVPVRDPSKDCVDGFIAIYEVSTVVPNLFTVVINETLQGCIT